MTQGELQNIISDAKQTIYEYKYNIQHTLDCIEKVRKLDIENADIKEDIDSIASEMERKLISLLDDMKFTF